MSSNWLFIAAMIGIGSTIFLVIIALIIASCIRSYKNSKSKKIQKGSQIRALEEQTSIKSGTSNQRIERKTKFSEKMYFNKKRCLQTKTFYLNKKSLCLYKKTLYLKKKVIFP